MFTDIDIDVYLYPYLVRHAVCETNGASSSTRLHPPGAADIRKTKLNNHGKKKINLNNHEKKNYKITLNNNEKIKIKE